MVVLAAGSAFGQDAAYAVKMMTPETALKAAQAALRKCRDDGYQVTVAVVDRSGVTQIVLRDRFAGPHTVEMAVDKAWTAVSFRTPTAELAKATLPGSPQSAIRNRPRVAAVAGGLLIEGGGSLVGGIGVSGAPGGERDDVCARAGIEAVGDSLEF
ncbi:MAG: heme-binding protein [Betaproteobacteria bacterium]|nr:heme-binding protein [Betaproteobacteria bacterium]